MRGTGCSPAPAPSSWRRASGSAPGSCLGSRPGSRSSAAIPGPSPLKLVANTDGPDLLATLGSSRRRDIDRGSTGRGPHLDDVELRDGGSDVRRYGSQGEQRRMLLGLILAEADLLAEERDELPLLLLDDVTGEFDAERRGLLLDAVGRFDQAILTSTDEADLGGRATAIVRVTDGVARAA